VIEAAVAALEAGEPVVLPTDTVYGLCADPANETAVLAVYTLKGRQARQPTALLARDVDALVERVPELSGPVESQLRALLPGPFTLVVPNPARRFPWLGGDRPDTIGLRAPELGGLAAAVIDRVGSVVATSANLAGGPDPRRLEDVPERIRSGCGALVDGGVLPGTPSTVLDLTGPEPLVVREGVVTAAEAVARARAATSGSRE
jgi:L-threonylcarbamoyladenylate synthase